MYDRNLASITLGRYQLLVAIARGGMGQVWLGRLQGARGFNKLVAVKTLLPNENDRPRLEAMLAEEARLSSLIQHANVVHTMELGEHEGLLYLVMEWVDGESLAFLQARAEERGGMPLGVAVALVSQLLAGLHAAHELSDESGPLGLVHRDVSPHNVLVTYDGVAKLLDFGIAKATQQASSTTEAGELKGKFTHMAPEQILGAEVDRRCDVFAAGIVLYCLTTGQHPFKHDTTAALIHAIAADGPATLPSSIAPGFPAALEQVLMKALEKDVDKRFGSAEEMRVALEQAMPQAFGDGGRTALRELMERAVGDRKIARREAVRRAQLAANYRDAEAKTARLQAADSAASLRAISISRSEGPDAPDSTGFEAPPKSSAPTLRPQRKAPKHWLAAGAGVLVALAALLPRLLTAPEVSHAASSGGPVPGTLLASQATAAPKSATSNAPQALQPSSRPEPPPSSQPEPPTVTSASARAPAAKPSAAKAAPPAKRAVKASPSKSSELLSPDYARSGRNRF